MSQEETNRQKLWENLTSQTWQIELPVFPEVALRRILIASEDKPLILFTPWGPPYNKNGFNFNNGPEVRTLKRLSKIAELFSTHGVSIRWKFLCADIYGTEINKLGSLDGLSRVKEDVTDKYFHALRHPASHFFRNANETFERWSEVRTKYQAAYLLLKQEYTNGKIKQLISESLLGQMTHTARLINRLDSKEEAEIMALRYLQERISEALLIEEIWHPIKISLAPRKRDEVVDMGLPRLYLIPPELQTPWLVSY